MKKERKESVEPLYKKLLILFGVPFIPVIFYFIILHKGVPADIGFLGAVYCVSFIVLLFIVFPWPFVDWRHIWKGKD